MHEFRGCPTRFRSLDHLVIGTAGRTCICLEFGFDPLLDEPACTTVQLGLDVYGVRGKWRRSRAVGTRVQYTCTHKGLNAPQTIRCCMHIATASKTLHHASRCEIISTFYSEDLRPRHRSLMTRTYGDHPLTPSPASSPSSPH
jgi:hypothetical protein